MAEKLQYIEVSTQDHVKAGIQHLQCVLDKIAMVVSNKLVTQEGYKSTLKLS